MAFPVGWLRKCELTIQNGKIDDALSNFPVLITETCLPQGVDEIFDADGAHPAQNLGGDIRFSASEDGTNQLDCEVVTFTTDNNPALGKAELWVKVPSIASDADTSIWIWWKTAGADSQPAEDANFGKEQTWDDGGNDWFKMVQHMDDTTTSSITDSTQYDNDGAKKGANEPIEATGAFAGGTQGKSQDFDGDDDLIDVSSLATLMVAGGYTVSIWLKKAPGEGGTRMGYLSDEDGGSYQSYIQMSQTAALRFEDDAGNFGSVDIELSEAEQENWHCYVLRVDSSGDDNVFYDGAFVDVSAATFGDVTYLYIGPGYRAEPLWNGLMDEIRLSNTERSAAWIKAEFENQSDPHAFIVEGTPEAVGINLNIGDVWKSVDGVQIDIGVVWKTIAEIYTNIGNAWKRIV